LYLVPLPPYFKEFDTNGDGQITAEEFEISVAKNGDKFNVSEVKALINLFDTNGDGKINYEEFLNMMTVRYKSLFQMSSNI
jgi:Ca2+-binding EF-hand superfamily protein